MKDRQGKIDGPGGNNNTQAKVMLDRKGDSPRLTD
jgi:hypothetical protein